MSMQPSSEATHHGRRRLLRSAAIAMAAGGAAIALVLAVSGGVISAEDKYKVQVRGGLAFSEFRGFEDWATVAVTQSGDLIEVILANPVMIKAYRAGAPGNGKPAGHHARHRFHGVGQKEIFEDRQLGIRPVQL